MICNLTFIHPIIGNDGASMIFITKQVINLKYNFNIEKSIVYD